MLIPNPQKQFVIPSSQLRASRRDAETRLAERLPPSTAPPPLG
jgi:hypothetical protein